ncbi:MAG: hypothetical protein K2K00_07625 [Muribaculaceae bacterium]|nr:hypothetical protein [Muribaculaceae bacterium]MDE6703530.1 hypothetical protein [Muribaculaceae bacterium]
MLKKTIENIFTLKKQVEIPLPRVPQFEVQIISNPLQNQVKTGQNQPL